MIPTTPQCAFDSSALSHLQYAVDRYVGYCPKCRKTVFSFRMKELPPTPKPLILRETKRSNILAGFVFALMGVTLLSLCILVLSLAPGAP